MLDIIRAFAVMIGGPLILLVVTLTSAGWALAAVVQGDTLPWWAVLPLAGLVGYVVAFRPWTRRWGASRAECRRTLPGDEQVPDPAIQMTRAITIDAPPERVWPWIAQIGQDRGGFYSYTWLENLAGCRMRNADRVHPDWQQRAVGDTVLLHPMAGLQLTRFDVNSAYALQGWYFALEPVHGNCTRLLARSRVPRGPAAWGYALFIELPHFIMERKMLRTLERRVEHNEAAAE